MLRPLSAPGSIGFGMPTARVAASAPTYKDLILSESPFSYYRLGEASGISAADDSGNGHDGTYLGGFTLNQSGIPGAGGNPAALLDGNTGYIDCGFTPTPGTADFSIAGWVKCSGSGVYVAAGAFVGADDFYLAQLNATTWVWNINNSGGGPANSLASATVSTNDGNWHHVAGVRRLGIGYIYIDAAETVGAGYPGSCRPGASLKLGQLGASLFFWPGDLDEWAYFPYGLSAAQIAAQYTAGRR